jgi:hypothetical protein
MSVPPIATIDDCKNLLRTEAGTSEVSDGMLSALACLFYKKLDMGEPDSWLGSTWDVLDRMNDARTGYDAFAALQKKSGTIVIINRGVEGNLSQKDWFKAIGMTFGNWQGQPIEQAVDFAARVIRDHGAARAVAISGHSMGAALMEAQMALARTAAGKPVLPARGLGLGSATFMKALRNLAAARNLAIAGSAGANIVHHVRARDAINVQPGRVFLGKVLAPASVWQPRWQVRGTGNSKTAANSAWVRVADGVENHGTLAYHAWRGIPELRPDGSFQHIFRRKSGALELRPGKEAPSIKGTALPQEDA